MSTYTYPASQFDDPALLISLLGRFWDTTYGAADQVTQLLYARGQLKAQTFLRLGEVADALSQKTIRPFRTRHWQLFAPQLSQLNGSVAVPRYGQGGNYQPAGGFQYGVPAPSGEFALPLPANLYDVRLICNRLTEPSVVLVRDVDFRIDLAVPAIYFQANPFANPLFQRQSQVGDGVVTNETLQLWLFRGEYDFSDLYTQFGCIVGIQAPSSEAYKQLINSVFDSLISGGSLADLQAAFAAVTGVPLANGTETVELLTQDAQWQYVITDQSVYKFQLSATPLVTVGQVVAAGDPLVTALQFYEFNSGQVPEDLDAVILGPGFLLSGFYSGLIFSNQDVPLIVTEDQGYTRVEWELGGFPGDITAFWDQVHANGIAAGQTLAMLLDQRASPIGQPSAASLPATINPLGFLAANVFRNNVSLVRIVATDTNPGTLSLGLLSRVLRRMVQPQAALLVLVELSVPTDVVIMDQPATETMPGYTEEIDSFVGADPVVETIDPADYITEDVHAWQTGGYCK